MNAVIPSAADDGSAYKKDLTSIKAGMATIKADFILIKAGQVKIERDFLTLKWMVASEFTLIIVVFLKVFSC